MLQYILTESERFSTAELAQMAIEGGCGWIDIHLPLLDDSALRGRLVPDVVDMCRESGVFLTVDDRPELARELGLHGVRITLEGAATSPALSAAALREELGPEAVIGVETADPSAIPSLAAADVDYVCTPAAFDAAARAAFISAAKATGTEMPVVAQGHITAANVAAFIAEGFSGVAVSASITDAADPVSATDDIINTIRQSQS